MCNNNAYRWYVIACCLLVCLLFFSCKKQADNSSSSRQYGTVTFTINWESIGVEYAEQNTLCYCFYPLNNGPMIQTESSTGTLKIALPPGKYGLLVYNSNNNTIKLRNRSQFDHAEAYFNIKEEDDASSSPLYGTIHHDLLVVADKHETITLTPTYFTKCVLFDIKLDEKDMGKIKGCKGVLTGVTPALHVSNRKMNRTSTTQLPIFLQKTSDGFEGKLFLWDGDTSQQVSHELILTFTLFDGQKMSSTLGIGPALFDIKKQDIRMKVNASVDSQSSAAQIQLRCDSITPELLSAK
ncbi:hypothetical protein M2137_002648 [Parabacteroides sp. PFB2-10]|uniref:DUF5119 domain-containing protein n=1 Tax=Parabacteroides sp. PFB2-10 TaxID=1742405 RepID=UPI0024732533|nr:DUF5119 domain-containing protein [Parabacteroides sp. PFB2-10]MDH6313857.1 hypothetical protein [Parabacteroides sp. PFB2-10]MDL2244924.1 DUF5119 domain-containing protein [Parabacteroides sp. OttesenSCG-928-J18]